MKHNAPAALRSCCIFETERFTLTTKFDMEKKLDNTMKPQHDAKLPVMWRFSGVRVRDGMVVYGEFPFVYQEGRECYNMSAFWMHVRSGYIDPETVSQNAT